MESITHWLANICALVFFITAVEMILPENSMRKYGKLVLGLILMTMIINPLVMLINNGKNINSFIEDIYTSAEYEQKTESNNYAEKNINKTKEIFKLNVEKLCKEKLEKQFKDETYTVTAAVKYADEKFVIETIKIYPRKKGVSTVRKVTLDEEEEDQHSVEIKKYISEEMGVESSIISVMKN